MTLPPKSGHDATREDVMATSVSLAWIKVGGTSVNGVVRRVIPRYSLFSAG
jgi:hypothetical protein